MKNELYSLYKTYDKKEIGNDYIENVFELLLKNDQELRREFINNLIIKESIEEHFGTYNNETNNITFNRTRVIDDNRYKINKKLLTIEVLKHEIEHARNLKILYEGKKDIHSTVISYSLRNYAINHGLIRKSRDDEINQIVLNWKRIKNYEIDTGERIAEIKAWKYIVNLLKNQRTTEDLLLARSMLYYSYIRGYKDNGYYLNAPTYEYLLELGLYREYKILKERVEKNNYSLETRLLNGLPIKYKEYDKEVLRMTRLRLKKEI